MTDTNFSHATVDVEQDQQNPPVDMRTESPVSQEVVTETTAILPDMVDANTFAELMDYYGDQLITIEQDSPVDKADLVNVPFIITTWMEGKDNKYGSENGFVVVRAITAQDDKVFFTDGGTGIAQQLRALEKRTGRRGGYAIRKGLRVSEYEAQSDAGEKIMAKTFYLS